MYQRNGNLSDFKNVKREETHYEKTDYTCTGSSICSGADRLRQQLIQRTGNDRSSNDCSR
jgi:hypothetical protein